LIAIFIILDGEDSRRYRTIFAETEETCTLN